MGEDVAVDTADAGAVEALRREPGAGDLGSGTESGRWLGDRAVVIGGSIAGTLAARVLSECYRNVLVLDRDDVLGVSVPRRSAPHTVHAHGLHGRGYLILAELFPNLLAEARSIGLGVRDFGGMRWYFDGRPIRRTETGIVSVVGARPVLENHLRSRVATLPNVTYRQATEVVGLCVTDDGRRVSGVRAQARGEHTKSYEISADLVIDASGRGSRTPAWLSQLGYARPSEERIKIGLAYTTRSFRRRPGTFGPPEAINPVSSPACPRGAFFGQTPTGDCKLSLTGMIGDRPPVDPVEFMEFARSLPVPDIYDAVRDADATSDAVSFTIPASVWRHYERLQRLPERLVVVGDALCSFNPVYGQGMTVAAMQAMALRSQLRQQTTVDTPALVRAVTRTIRHPWQLSTCCDLNFPEVVGARPPWVRLLSAYLVRVQYAATKDSGVTTAFMRVAGLLDPPRRLWRPSLVAKVMWLSRDIRVANAPVSAPAPA